MAYIVKIDGSGGIGIEAGAYTIHDHNKIIDFYNSLTEGENLDYVKEQIEQTISNDSIIPVVMDDALTLPISPKNNALVFKLSTDATVTSVRVDDIVYPLYNIESVGEPTPMESKFKSDNPYVLVFKDGKCFTESPNLEIEYSGIEDVIQKPTNIENISNYPSNRTILNKVLNNDGNTSIGYLGVSTHFKEDLGDSFANLIEGYISVNEEITPFSIRVDGSKEVLVNYNNSLSEYIKELYIEESTFLVVNEDKIFIRFKVVSNGDEPVTITINKTQTNDKAYEDRNHVHFYLYTLGELTSSIGSVNINNVNDNLVSRVVTPLIVTKKLSYLGTDYIGSEIKDIDILNIPTIDNDIYENIQLMEDTYTKFILEIGGVKYLYERERIKQSGVYTDVEYRYSLSTDDLKSYSRNRPLGGSWTPFLPVTGGFNKSLYGEDTPDGLTLGEILLNIANAGNEDLGDIDEKRDIASTDTMVTKPVLETDPDNTLLTVKFVKDNIAKSDSSLVTSLEEPITELTKPLYGLIAPVEDTPIGLSNKTVTRSIGGDKYFLKSSPNARLFPYLGTHMSKALSPTTNVILPVDSEPFVHSSISYSLGNRPFATTDTYSKILGAVTASSDIRDNNSDGDRVPYVMRHTRVKDENVSYRIPVSTGRVVKILSNDSKNSMLINGSIIKVDGSSSMAIKSCYGNSSNYVIIDSDNNLLARNKNLTEKTNLSNILPSININTIHVTDFSIVIVHDDTSVSVLQHMKTGSTVVNNSSLVATLTRSHKDIRNTIFFNTSDKSLFAYSRDSDEILEYSKDSLPTVKKKIPKTQCFYGGNKSYYVTEESTLEVYDYVNDTTESFYLEELEDYDMKHSDGVTIIYSPTSKGVIYIMGNITNRILPYDMNLTSPIKLNFFANRYLRVVDVFISSDIIMVIDDKGSCWYRTNTPSVGLTLNTDEIELDKGWLKVPLITNAFRFGDSEKPLIEDKAGGQYLIDIELNVSIDGSTTFIDNKAPQPINLKYNGNVSLRTKFSDAL